MHIIIARVARYYWSAADPEIVSDMLFAIANVLTCALACPAG